MRLTRASKPCAAAINGSSSNGRPSGGRGRRGQNKARLPGLFEVVSVSPPTKTSLGIHPLPPNTHNGDLIQVDETDFVVTSVVLKYKLVGGRYQRDHNRLEVQQMGRFFTLQYLEQMMGEDHRP